MHSKSFFGKKYKEYHLGNIVHLASDTPLKLSSGEVIQNFPVAYQTYGELNKAKNNAILICHALTGDQYVASKHPVTNKEGWWNNVVGPDKIIDTNKYFVICTNILGGCMGTLGPKETNPKTKKPYGLNFPTITIGDIVKVQHLLITEHFKISQLSAIIGGSMGGMQVLEWASKYPECLKCAIAIATAARHTAQNIAFHEVGRQAIMADQNWNNGNYIKHKSFPEKGLAVARMTAHITYLSEFALTEKFGRNLQEKNNFSFGADMDFQIESYLKHQGITFVDRFDANSYLYITRAMDYFDLEEEFSGELHKAFEQSHDINFCLISFSDDWLFPTSESKRILKALNYLGFNASFAEIPSNRGHDTFLIENHQFYEILHGFLEGNSLGSY